MSASTADLILDAMYVADYRERIAAAVDAGDYGQAIVLLSAAVAAARADAAEIDALILEEKSSTP